MKKLTIFDISKILKFDIDQTNDLKKDYENADGEKKVEIMDIMWKGFFELHKKLSDLKYKQLMQEVGEGKRNMTTDLYSQAKKLAMKEIENILSGTPQEVLQMDELRNKIKNLIPTTKNSTALN